MKKILLLVIVEMLSVPVCFSQIKTSGPSDTLVIKSMQYHYDIVAPEGYPFNFVIRTSSSFIFGDKEVKIRKFRDCGSRISEYGIDFGNKIMLLDIGNVIRIYYDGYILNCHKSGYTPESKQNNNDKSVSFLDLEKNPSFQGGDANDFARWVNEQLEYPEAAKRNGVQGRVMVSFTVDINGRVTDVKITRGVDPYLDAEAIRVVSKSPKWKPGKTGGKPVNVTYTIPVGFFLNRAGR